jgi:hypothetical protein
VAAAKAARSAQVRLELGGEKRTFRVGIDELERIQEETDAGPFELYGRLAAAHEAMAGGLRTLQGIALAAGCRLGPKDVSQVVYNGLVGGGLPPGEARKLTRLWIDARPIGEGVELAFMVMLAAVIGAPDEPVGELAGGAQKPARARRSKTAS